MIQKLVARVWTAQKVLQQIRQIAERKEPLNSKAVERSLSAAGHRIFGSWDEALKKCDIDPLTVRRQQTWSSERVINEIRSRHEAGLPINNGAIQKAWGSLLFAAKLRFNSWDAALKAAGFDPASVRRQLPPWTRSRIIEYLRSLRDKRMPLLPRQVKPRSICFAANRLFGSWKSALRAAGLSVDHIYRNRIPWTRARLIRAIREGYGRNLYQQDWGVPMTSIRRTACKFFQTWPAAVKAAGFDPAKTIKRGYHAKWTPTSLCCVLSEILDARARGERVKIPKRVRRAVHRLVGTLDAARKLILRNKTSLKFIEIST